MKKVDNGGHILSQHSGQNLNKNSILDFGNGEMAHLIQLFS